VAVFKDLYLITDFKPGSGLTVSQLPKSPGLYAEVYWPERGLRIGESKSIRQKIRHDIAWINAMYNGSADETQLRRVTPIAQAAKATGVKGFEFYLVSDDPRLEDRALRHETERFLFKWAEQAEEFKSWNFQRSWQKVQ